jgi:hypothetical protein
MTKFEEFEQEMGPSVEKILPGAKCAKILVLFVDDDGAHCEIGITREGFEFVDDEEE